VIHDVDEALRRMVTSAAPLPCAEVDVVFDAPTKDWAARRNAPTVNVFLYDIREDVQRRQRGMLNSYENKVVTALHLPPRYVRLSYLVSAWTRRPEEEHEALARMLRHFIGHDALPPDLVGGTLAELGLPVPLTVALPPQDDRSFTDVWSALGGELKPSLDVVVSAPLDPGRTFPAAPVPRVGLGTRVATFDGVDADGQPRDRTVGDTVFPHRIGRRTMTRIRRPR
jgi:Pvc16 N-terminal domain